MGKLTAAESKIIRSLLIKQYGPASPFLDQLARSRVEKRRHTGVGIFVDLQVHGNAAPVDQINVEISGDYRTTHGSPSDVVGFILFIRRGRLSFLEGYTFGEAKWPDEPMENWLILEQSAAHKAK